MKLDYKSNYINDIAKHMINNNIALFVGAGFSSLFGYPSWSKLLKDIIEEYDLKEKLQETSLFSFVSNDEFENADNINDTILDKLLGVDYLRLAGYIDYILKNDYDTSIHKAIGEKISQYEYLRKKDKKVEYIIDFFQNNKSMLEDIITTNYDTNIEFCFNQEISVINRNLQSLNNISYKNKIFKIHGCINDIYGGIIITEKDYNDFKNKNKYLFYKIYSFFTEKKIVFIGYSINDPNIRSLLNDVIEESGDKVGIQIYWVTRENLKKLDKKYYEEHFKLNIIEETEIIDFLRELEKALKLNLELRKATKEDINSLCDLIIDRYEDKKFIYEVLKGDNIDEILQCFYNKLIENITIYAINPYFKLLSKVDREVILKNKLAIQNIIEMENSIILRIVELLDSDVDVLNLIKDNNMSNIVINSLIKYSYGRKNFGVYARCIKDLLILYKHFKDEIKENINEYINVLSYNISKSCTSNKMILGYDWKGLDQVKEYITVLDKEDYIKLLDKLKEDYELEVQIQYVISNTNYYDDDGKKELRYKYIYKHKIKNFIIYTVKSVMRNELKSRGFEMIDRNIYKLNHIELKITTKEMKEDKSIYCIDDLNNNIVMRIEQNFIDSKIILTIDEDTIEYKKYKDFKLDKYNLEDKIQLKFIEDIESYMSIVLI